MSLLFEQIDTGSNPKQAVIWLHGLGADGHDFAPIVPELGLPADAAVRFIFPHAPEQPVTINGGYVMRAWYDIYSMDFVRGEDESGIEQSRKAVTGLMQQLNEQGIADDSIVLAGFSQGGAIVLHTGLRHPQTLAGIMALSTYVPLADSLESQAHEANAQTPVFMAHGNADPVVPFALGERSRELLQTRQQPLQWREYPMEHNVCAEEIRDIGQWLRQVLGL